MLARARNHSSLEDLFRDGRILPLVAALSATHGHAPCGSGDYSSGSRHSWRQPQGIAAVLAARLSPARSGKCITGRGHGYC